MTDEDLEQFLARVRRDRVAAGLPEVIDDPVILAAIAQVLRESDRKEVVPKR